MIQNDQELHVTQRRVAEFQKLLAQLRVTADPDEFPLVTSSYCSEIEKMNQDILEYLTRHASHPVSADSA